jgi:hypothetical protein
MYTVYRVKHYVRAAGVIKFHKDFADRVSASDKFRAIVEGFEAKRFIVIDRYNADLCLNQIDECAIVQKREDLVNDNNVEIVTLDMIDDEEGED